MKNTVLIAFFIALGWGVNSQCSIDPNNIYTFTYNGSDYQIVKQNYDWVTAAGCASSGGNGYLCEINSQEEQDTVFYHVNQAGIIASSTVAPDGGGASYLWIGGNDLATEGNWVWDGDNTGATVQFWQGTSSGTAVGGLYNNWGNEPDDFNGQDALGFAFTNWPLGAAGEWNDVDETNQLFFIIESPSTASTDNESINELNLDIFPNPTKGEFTIRGLTGEGWIELMDASGSIISSQKFEKSSSEVTIDGGLGIYFVRVTSNNHENVILKVFKALD